MLYIINLMQKLFSKETVLWAIEHTEKIVIVLFALNSTRQFMRKSIGVTPKEEIKEIVKEEVEGVKKEILKSLHANDQATIDMLKGELQELGAEILKDRYVNVNSAKVMTFSRKLKLYHDCGGNGEIDLLASGVWNHVTETIKKQGGGNA